MNDATPATEAAVAVTRPPANPLRKIILIVLALLLVLFVYHVLSDRFTPYTSQARVESFLTQIAPEVAGDVLEVGVKDNGQVRKGQLLFRIDPEPYQLAVRAAEANLSVALQGADVSVADVAAARAESVLALHQLNEGLDRLRRVFASQRLHVGELAWPAARIARDALGKRPSWTALLGC